MFSFLQRMILNIIVFFVGLSFTKKWNGFDENRADTNKYHFVEHLTYGNRIIQVQHSQPHDINYVQYVPLEREEGFQMPVSTHYGEII